MNATFKPWFFLAVSMVLSGCVGELVGEAPTVAVEEATDDDDVRLADVVIMVEPDESGSEIEGALAAGVPPRRTIFLNRYGGAYYPGPNDSSTNRSAIISRTVQIPAYRGTDQQWSWLLGCVREQFAPWNVEITDRNPGAAPHIEAVIGGHPSHLGYQGNIGGVSPMNLNCTVVERSVTFVFSEVFPNLRHLCEVTAHEIGHSIGLDHEYLCTDPMSYLYGCGDKSFQNQSAWCGEYSARQCRCGSSQNSHQLLTRNLGLAPTEPPPQTGDTTPPLITDVQPADGATLTGHRTLQVSATVTDDTAVASVELVWDSPQLTTVSCDSPPQGVTCTRSGDRHTYAFQVGTGPRSFYFQARDSAGNSARSATHRIELSGGQPPPPPPPPPPAPTVYWPQPSTLYGGNQLVQVRVSADPGSTQGWISWGSPAGTYFYYLVQMDETTWGIDLRLPQRPGHGARTIRATTVGAGGQQATSAPLTIYVQ